MILSSVTFLAFLALCLLGHYLLPQKMRNFWLLLSSVAFFCYAMPAQTLIMMIFCLLIWLLGFAVAAGQGRVRKFCLFIGVVLSAGFLIFYKYLGFLASCIGLSLPAEVVSLVVPMGISYVTFQCIAYLVEIYKDRMAPESDMMDFFVYALFFAKLTAGPIEAPQGFLQQLKQPRTFNLSQAKTAILRMSMGFVKKIVVADYLALGVAAVFEKGAQAGGWAVAIGSCMYSVQLLCDFSGYTDIARGAAALFGIELTENFDAPYMATDVRDFWRRWHISLSNWLKNYIYIPLGGSRVCPLRRYGNVIMTFLVSGVWHGASFTFVVWGTLHGVYQALQMLLEPLAAKVRSALKIPVNHPVRLWLCRGFTFVLVTVAWVFFRAQSVDLAFGMLGSLFRSWGSIGQALALCKLDVSAVLLIFFGLLSSCLMNRLLRLESRRKHSDLSVFHICLSALWAVVLVYMVCAAAGGGNSFIYFDF